MISTKLTYLLFYRVIKKQGRKKFIYKSLYNEIPTSSIFLPAYILRDKNAIEVTKD